MRRAADEFAARECLQPRIGIDERFDRARLNRIDPPVEIGCTAVSLQVANQGAVICELVLNKPAVAGQQLFDLGQRSLRPR